MDPVPYANAILVTLPSLLTVITKVISEKFRTICLHVCLFCYHARDFNEWKQWALEIREITITVRDSYK